MLPQMGLNDLLQNGITQLIFAGEMMKKRSFGGVRRVDDMIQAAALKAVLMKLLESREKNFPTRLFWCFGDSSIQFQNNTDQSVCCQTSTLPRSDFAV